MISSSEFAKKQILFLFSNDGDKLSFANDNIIVKDKEGVIKHQSTCYKLFLICVIGNTVITSGLLQRAKKYGFSICLMSPTMRVYQIISSHAEGNTLLRRRQYEYQGLDIAKHIVNNKILNQQQALKNYRQKNEDVKSAIMLLDNYLSQVYEAETLSELMGVEGQAARVYFPRIFNYKEWQGRKPRIKSDYINATLDIAYTVLFQIVEAILGSYGFDTYYGVLHSCFYMRKSLVCDIMEPLRPMIDIRVRKAINLKQCKSDDFQIHNYRFNLSWKENTRYVSWIMEEILGNKEKIFLYIQGYYRAFMKQKDISEFPRFEM